ncbi:MAG TPA: phosphoesterase [Polyangia bacterium]|nr:phosphoesterase [Polyangia bacterium]
MSANLIVNGDAEAAVGSTDGSPVTTPGWTVDGEATAVQYGASSYPAATDPGPADRGNNFFAGGAHDELSTLSQTIDVSTYATAIDAGGVQAALSGYFGGWQTQNDIAVMTATFQDGSATAIGQAVTIGGVNANDRDNMTEFLLRTATQAVPAGTRSISIVVTMTRTDGTADDGYADDLSLILVGI